MQRRGILLAGILLMLVIAPLTNVRATSNPRITPIDIEAIIIAKLTCQQVETEDNRCIYTNYSAEISEVSITASPSTLTLPPRAWVKINYKVKVIIDFEVTNAPLVETWVYIDKWLLEWELRNKYGKYIWKEWFKEDCLIRTGRNIILNYSDTLIDRATPGFIKCFFIKMKDDPWYKPRIEYGIHHFHFWYYLDKINRTGDIGPYIDRRYKKINIEISFGSSSPAKKMKSLFENIPSMPFFKTFESLLFKSEPYDTLPVPQPKDAPPVDAPSEQKDQAKSQPKDTPKSQPAKRPKVQIESVSPSGTITAEEDETLEFTVQVDPDTGTGNFYYIFYGGDGGSVEGYMGYTATISYTYDSEGTFSPSVEVYDLGDGERYDARYDFAVVTVVSTNDATSNEW